MQKVQETGEVPETTSSMESLDFRDRIQPSSDPSDCLSYFKLVLNTQYPGQLQSGKVHLLERVLQLDADQNKQKKK